AAKLAAGQVELLGGVTVWIPALEHLHERADRREWVANLVSDSRGQEPERRHLLLGNDAGLRGTARSRALRHALLQLVAIERARMIELFKPSPRCLEQPREGGTRPRGPREDDHRQHEA